MRAWQLMSCYSAESCHTPHASVTIAGAWSVLQQPPAPALLTLESQENWQSAAANKCCRPAPFLQTLTMLSVEHRVCLACALWHFTCWQTRPSAVRDTSWDMVCVVVHGFCHVLTVCTLFSLNLMDHTQWRGESALCVMAADIVAGAVSMHARYCHVNDSKVMHTRAACCAELHGPTGHNFMRTSPLRDDAAGGSPYRRLMVMGSRG